MLDLVTGELISSCSSEFLIAGVDEVGRGAWAGPISVGVACARKQEILDLLASDRDLRRVNDSKLLSPNARLGALNVITQYFRTSVGSASSAECDQLGLTSALRIASERAFEGIGLRADLVLLDGKFNYLASPNVANVVKGDTKSVVIAAASVVAKLARDAYMNEIDESYPYWNFSSNKGYPSPAHRRALAIVGLSSIHRLTWRYVDSMNLSVGNFGTNGLRLDV